MEDPTTSSMGRADGELNQPTTPVSRAYRDWLEYYGWLNSNATDHCTRDEFDDLCEVSRQKERAMYALPSEGTRDIVLKLLAFTGNGMDFAESLDETGIRLLQEARQLVQLP